MDNYIKITLVRSPIGAIPKQKRTVTALGFGKLNSSVVQKDNPQIRGMIHKVRHLVTVEAASKEMIVEKEKTAKSKTAETKAKKE